MLKMYRARNTACIAATGGLCTMNGNEWKDYEQSSAPLNA